MANNLYLTLKVLWILLYIYKFSAAYENSFDCDFDHGFCNWQQDTTDDFDWTRLSGKTPTDSTGPDSDHTSGEGAYVYIETSPRENENMNDDKAILISPQMNSGKYCLSFWYHMHGEDIGTLFIYIPERTSNRAIFYESGNKEKQWKLGQKQFAARGSFQIYIEGKTTNNQNTRYGDIAIDDIILFPSDKCPTGCGDPTPNAGYANSKNFNIGSKVKIACYSGYNIEGNPSIFCLAKGSWSGRPTCQPKDCMTPTFNSGIIGNVSEGTTFNMRIILSCAVGFTLIGNAFITCQADGKWSKQPYCVINNCSDPTPKSGMVDNRNFQYGSVIEVTCIEGYKISGNSTIICQANSTWNNNPVCNLIECKIMVIPNGYFNSTLGTTIGKIATQSCDIGYIFSGDKTITCLEDGWNGTIATCSIVECETIDITNGYFDTTLGTTFGKVATQSCDTGFTLSGDDSVTCYEGGWNGTIATCTAVDSEASYLLLVYATVPVVVIVLILVLAFVIWRKRHIKCSNAKATPHNPGQETTIQSEIETSNTNGLKNQRYISETSEPIQPDEEYSCVTDHKQVTPADAVIYNTFDNTCEIGNDVEDHYDHTNDVPKSFTDNLYSHLSRNKSGNTEEEETTYDTTSRQNLGNGFSKTKVQTEYDSDSQLNIKRIQQKPKASIQEETEYANTTAGGNTVRTEQDDLHLNKGNKKTRTVGKDVSSHVDCEYSKVIKRT